MKKQEVPARLAIAGGGISGMLAAINIARLCRVPLHICIINNGTDLGKGIAYSTVSEKHLLNVPAGKMSCWSDQPDHFVEWILQQPEWNSHTIAEVQKAYMPRKIYGDYLADVWTAFQKENLPFVSVEVIPARVLAVTQTDLYRLELDHGDPVESDFLILATGNESPANLEIIHNEFYSGKRYFRKPWEKHATENIPEGDVLIIGNGLTMVDTVLSLMENGFNGKIWSLSRHGFSILPHRVYGKAYTGLLNELKLPCDLLTLFRLFRKHMKLAAEAGLPEESVVDSVRTISQEIWQGLTLPDKRSFITHLRHLWGYARHRLPANVYDEIESYKQSGRLQILKGRLYDIRETENEARIVYRDAVSGSLKEIPAVRVINCTGPLSDIRRTENPLLKSLLGKGMIRPDALHLGMDTGSNGALISSSGIPNERLFTLGSSLRGLLWESTAVPELRSQAERLAITILNEYGKQFARSGEIAG